MIDYNLIYQFPHSLTHQKLRQEPALILERRAHYCSGGGALVQAREGGLVPAVRQPQVQWRTFVYFRESAPGKHGPCEEEQEEWQHAPVIGLYEHVS
jgi:hypothetical protein